MYDQIIEGLTPYVRSGAIDDVRSLPKVGPNAFVVQSGSSTSVVNVTEDGIEVVHGDDKASILSGISPSQAVLFILQSLGRADFEIPSQISVRFQAEDFPQKVTSAVLAPVGITKGAKEGVFNAVYKDANGKFYVHQDECRISLRLYKDLYDRNNEAQMLALPKLFSSEVPPLLTNEFTMVTEEFASEVVRGMKLASFAGTIEKGVPVRLESAAIPETGVLRIGSSELPAKDVRTNMLKLASAWETALTGKVPEAPKPVAFNSVQFSLGRAAATSGRVEVILEFAAPWPKVGDIQRDGIFSDVRKVVMSKADAASLLDKFTAIGEAVVSSDEKVIAQCLELAKEAKSEISSEAKQVKSCIVSSLVAASTVKATDTSFVVSATTLAGTSEKTREEFVKEAAIPAWMASCKVFSSVRLG